MNAVYRYLISVSFSKLKRISIIELSNPKEANALEEEPSQPDNRCGPIDSSASDEEEVTSNTSIMKVSWLIAHFLPR
jgi:hypothetical protein